MLLASVCGRSRVSRWCERTLTFCMIPSIGTCDAREGDNKRDTETATCYSLAIVVSRVQNPAPIAGEGWRAVSVSELRIHQAHTPSCPKLRRSQWTTQSFDRIC